MKLQVIFISNLLEPKTNRVKECFWQGKRDKFSTSSCKWPDAKLDSIAISTWQAFMKNITSSDRIVLSPVNTSNQVSSHHQSILHISQLKDILALDHTNGFTYYKLKSNRNKLQVERAIAAPRDETFEWCECIMSNKCIQISRTIPLLPHI